METTKNSCNICNESTNTTFTHNFYNNDTKHKFSANVCEICEAFLNILEEPSDSNTLTKAYLSLLHRTVKCKDISLKALLVKYYDTKLNDFSE